MAKKTNRIVTLNPIPRSEPEEPPVDVLANLAKDPDWNPDTPLDEGNLPLRPLFWTVLVWPMEPVKTSKGGIDLSATKKMQEILVTVGQLIAIGSQAFTGKTNSGCDLSKENIAVGDWVVWPKYTGNELRLKSGHRLIILNDSDLMAVAKRPADLLIF